MTVPRPDVRVLEAFRDRVLVIPYPSLSQHGIIGDRRTAGLVATDGTLDWLCLPDFDGETIFGALLDWPNGGYWRLGPARMASGRQTYSENSMVLETQWDLKEGSLSLQDAMLWPETERPPEQVHVRTIVRSLRCTHGVVRCEFDLQAGCNFKQLSAVWMEYASGRRLQFPEFALRLWTNYETEIDGSRLRQSFELREGEELWAVLDVGATGQAWSIEAARSAVEQTRKYWKAWVGGLDSSVVAEGLRRTAMVVHLLTYAPEGSVVAAPTTSLPERIGGDWNADYRYCWVRDASLSVSVLALLGNLQDTEMYLRWVVRRMSRFGQPLQVLYDIRGGKRPRQKKLLEVAGYQGSQPVRIGNHAYKQFQLGSYGYLVDCIWIYLRKGGPWREEYWKLVHRLAT